MSRAFSSHWLRHRLVLAAVTLMALFSLAAGSATFSLRGSTVAAGGGRSVGGVFAVTGIAAQPESGVSSGGAFRVSGGMLSPVEVGVSLYLPAVRTPPN
jgi:hypothetical protein